MEHIVDLQILLTIDFGNPNIFKNPDFGSINVIDIDLAMAPEFLVINSFNVFKAANPAYEPPMITTFGVIIVRYW